MHKLFNLTSPVSQGINKNPEWNYVRDTLKRNLGTVISFYRRNPKAVRSSHLLIRLLHSITVPQSQNLERYYDNVDTVSLNVAMTLKMTSAIYKGQIFHGVFYGQDNIEIIIAHNESFNPLDAHKDWQNLCPVTVLRHPRSDLALNLPDGINTGSESGYAVIAVNVTMLAVQYRAFRMNENYITGEGESQLSMSHFIHMYVLPNMLATHLDQAIFNRFNNIFIGAPLGQTSKPHSFFLANCDVATKVLTSLIDRLNNGKRDFITTLRTIPGVFKNDMDEVMMLPDIPPTRQVNWATAVARMEVITFLFKIAGDNLHAKNHSAINAILKTIKMYQVDNVMKSILPLDIFYNISDDMETIVRLGHN